MDKLRKYIADVLGITIHPQPMENKDIGRIPMYVKEGFNIDYAFIYNDKIIVAEAKHNNNLTTTQLEKQLQLLKDTFHSNVVLVKDDLSAIDRRRLIEKGINFIVPGKQLFLPNLLIDLREHGDFGKNKPKHENLLPSAQYILLYHMLHRQEDLSSMSMKQLADKLGYTQMAITKAVENLKQHELCKVNGTKEKYIHFEMDVNELWHYARELFVNPVLKTVYTDELPNGVYLPTCNIQALAEYTDMAPGRQQYRAIEKYQYYSLLKTGQWKYLNEKEGKYCLEVWKYEPGKLAEGVNEEMAVDPLSLYLSMRDNTDARIEMALEQIHNRFIW